MRGLAATTVFRWALAIAGGFTVMSLFLFASFIGRPPYTNRGRVDALVLSKASEIAAAPAADAVQLLEAWLAQDPHGNRYGAVFGSEDARVAGNIIASPDDLPADGTAHRVAIGPVGRDRDGDSPEIVRGVASRLRDGRLLVLGYDIDELDQVKDIVHRALGLGLIPAVLLSLTIGALLARRGQRRIAAVHLAISRVMQGHLHERLPVRGASDDLDKVAAAVNGMLDRIEQLVDDLRGVGDSMAHDLRTPLTRVRTRLERSRDDARTHEEFQAAADRAIASVDQALAIISAVLRIGEIEHGRRRAPLLRWTWPEVLREATELYEPVADEKNIALRLNHVPCGPVPGDRDLLLEAFGNLLDNAIKFAPADTTVTLSLHACTTGIRMRVADQGPGIPPAERERVLQRFSVRKRAAPSREAALD